jgi:two-component system phosphate regulon sensor histidine kinase PhoR
MGKKTIQLIILFSSLSLAGIIITQTLWVRNALDLSERQHSHRVDLALDDVLEELSDRTDSLIQNRSLVSASESEIQENLFQILDTVFLAHLLAKYVEYHSLDENYHYAIVRTTDDSIIYESTPGES